MTLQGAVGAQQDARLLSRRGSTYQAYDVKTSGSARLSGTALEQVLHSEVRVMRRASDIGASALAKAIDVFGETLNV